MSIKIRLGLRAQRDVDGIYRWISQRTQSGAAAWRRALELAYEQVATAPFLCTVAEESTKLRVEIRQCLFRTRRGRTFRMLFVVNQNEAFILCIRGPGQAPIGPADVVE